MGHVTLTMEQLVLHMLSLGIAYLYTKFDNSRFSPSRDMVGAHQTFNGSHDLTKPLSGMFCHPRARTYYNQPAYKI